MRTPRVRLSACAATRLVSFSKASNCFAASAAAFVTEGSRNGVIGYETEQYPTRGKRSGVPNANFSLGALETETIFGAFAAMQQALAVAKS
jgi:hypothetical protein